VRKFYRDYEVLQTRKRVQGKDLPIDQILVKLRKDGGRSKWTLLWLQEYQSHLRFGDSPESVNTNDKSE
jgi:hypothetical protein